MFYARNDDVKRHYTIYVIDLSEESINYMESCARIRKISCTRLMERLLKIVFEEQLVLSVLDDDSMQPARLPGELTKSHYRKYKEGA